MFCHSVRRHNQHTSPTPQVRTRRAWKALIAMAWIAAISTSGWATAQDDGPPAAMIGSRLELFVETSLVDQLQGDAKLVVQRPAAKEVVLTTDAPWEGNTSAYYTFLQDGDLYRV